MRFLFECVGCFMMSTPATSSSTVEPTSPSTPRTEETRSLVTPAPARGGRRKKRNPAKPTAPDWRPSLFAISEDNAIQVPPVKPENRNRPAPVAQKNAQRCGASANRVNARSQSRDFGPDPVPIVVPTFSAAPFMF